MEMRRALLVLKAKFQARGRRFCSGVSVLGSVPWAALTLPPLPPGSVTVDAFFNEWAGLPKLLDWCVLTRRDTPPSTLQQLLRQGLHIVCCYDDRPDIIKMYKNNEIEAQLVRLP